MEGCRLGNVEDPFGDVERHVERPFANAEESR